MAENKKAEQRIARHDRLRRKLAGTQMRPRLSIFRSSKHISAQVIDDAQGITLVSASTLEKSLSAKGNKAGAKAVGAAIAERAKSKGISQVVFDRGGFHYHGRVASLAEGAREAGLEF